MTTSNFGVAPNRQVLVITSPRRGRSSLFTPPRENCAPTNRRTIAIHVAFETADSFKSVEHTHAAEALFELHSCHFDGAALSQPDLLDILLDDLMQSTSDLCIWYAAPQICTVSHRHACATCALPETNVEPLRTTLYQQFGARSQLFGS